MITYPDYEEAFVGLAYIFGVDGPICVYDENKIYEILLSGGDPEPEEWIEHNIRGGYLGPNTPILIKPMSMEEAKEEIIEFSEMNDL